MGLCKSKMQYRGVRRSGRRSRKRGFHGRDGIMLARLAAELYESLQSLGGRGQHHQDGLVVGCRQFEVAEKPVDGGALGAQGRIIRRCRDRPVMDLERALVFAGVDQKLADRIEGGDIGSFGGGRIGGCQRVGASTERQQALGLLQQALHVVGIGREPLFDE